MTSAELVQRIRAWHEREMRAEAEAMGCAVLVAIAFGIASSFIEEKLIALGVGAAVGIALYLALRSYIKRLLSRPISYERSTVPLSQLSLYELHLEKDKAIHRKDDSHLRAIEAAIARKL